MEAKSENRVENGTAADEKLPLKNGIADKTQFVEDTIDQTDDLHRADTDNKPLHSLFKNNTKRKYKTYDNGKRNRINLAPLAASGIHIEKTIKEKTGLTRTGLVLAILCTLLTIALVVCFILWPKTPHSKLYSVCVKPSCLRSSAEILPKLNLNISPCSDFRNYVCGTWFSSNPLPDDNSEWNMKELMLLKYRQRVHRLLVTSAVSEITDGPSLSWKLKNFYDSCMDLDNIRNEGNRILMKDIESFGGWDVLKTFKSVRWNSVKTLEKLHSQYSVSAFFQIDVIPDTANSKQNIILLKPPALGLPNIDYYDQPVTSSVISAYIHYIKDIAQHFGATAVHAETFSQDLFSFEKRIAQYIATSSVENTTQPLYVRKKIKDLKQMLHPIQLHEIVSRKLPKVNFNQDAVLLVENIEYFQKLPSLFSMSDALSLNKYLIWCLVAEYVPYLDDKYVNTSNIFKKELTGQTKPKPRWEFCIITLQRFVGYGLMAMFESEIPAIEKENTISAVSQIFSESSSIVKKNVMKLKRSDRQQTMVEKLNSIGIRIGLPAYLLEQKRVDDYYNNFNPIRNDFFQNVMNGVGFIQENLQKKLKEQEEDRWLDDMISQPVSVTYNAATNYVIVPSPVLQQPYFEKDYPLMSLYGGIGTEVAKAVVFSLISDKSEDEKNKDIMAISECALGKNFAKLNVTNKELFTVTLAGLKYAYESLKDELSMVEHNHQPAMETFENEELFFIFYVQSICTTKTDRRIQNEILFSKVPNDSTLSNEVLNELSEFTNLYSCGQSSKYSSSLCNM